MIAVLLVVVDGVVVLEVVVVVVVIGFVVVVVVVVVVVIVLCVVVVKSEWYFHKKACIIIYLRFFNVCKTILEIFAHMSHAVFTSRDHKYEYTKSTQNSLNLKVKIILDVLTYRYSER